MRSRFSEDSVTGAERDKEQGVTEVARKGKRIRLP